MSLVIAIQEASASYSKYLKVLEPYGFEIDEKIIDRGGLAVRFLSKRHELTVVLNMRGKTIDDPVRSYDVGETGSTRDWKSGRSPREMKRHIDDMTEAVEMLQSPRVGNGLLMDSTSLVAEIMDTMSHTMIRTKSTMDRDVISRRLDAEDVQHTINGDFITIKGGAAKGFLNDLKLIGDFDIVPARGLRKSD